MGVDAASATRHILSIHRAIPLAGLRNIPVAKSTDSFRIHILIPPERSPLQHMMSLSNF
jgi:hypothetical protein